MENLSDAQNALYGLVGLLGMTAMFSASRNFELSSHGCHKASLVVSIVMYLSSFLANVAV